MRRRRGAAPAAAPIPVEIVDLLLLGWGNLPDTHAPGMEDYNWLQWYDHNDAELHALWHEHRAWLLGEAQRRGISSRPWAARQYDDEGQGDTITYPPVPRLGST